MQNKSIDLTGRRFLEEMNPMYRLMTKGSRQEARKAWINGRPTETYKDIEILSYEKDGTVYLVIWKGHAGNPLVNYVFRAHPEYAENYIAQEKQKADRREIYKQEQKSKGRTLTQSAQTSKLIKNILKKEYPSVDFSVTSDNFANGNSVDVRWTDGIPTKEIESFLRQFEYGSFDGMTDCYNYDNKHDHPQAKYVHASRSISENNRILIRKQLAEKMNIEDSDNAAIPDEYMANVRGYAYNAA